MRTVRLRLAPGSDLRQTLQELAVAEQAAGFVLGVVGNLSQAAFQCPGRSEPTVLSGELEIITLNGSLAPEGVHLHLSVSDGACQVWGGHLEPGSRVLAGADLLVGLLDAGAGTAPAGSEAAIADPPTPARPAAAAPPSSPAPAPASAPPAAGPRLAIAVLPGCPYSARALRLLRTLGIPHLVEQVESQEQRQRLQELSGAASLPQVFIDGEPVGGYDALADLHGSGRLEPLRPG
jgi:predicted DNA-binding protein with PD1-like motif/glutaredoxin